MTADEKKWRAQSDAETLARAEEIRNDKGRHTAAKTHAQKEAKRFTAVCKAPMPRK
ncbi:hypothetical protein [Ralstonia insidiosa]|uniref:hypothetical protein n=1 Tax=Ralstonia insidiosa TaxID=190721 RepID=UPI001427B55B|nr:hypothetical protein [Ralstonia insidiosa]